MPNWTPKSPKAQPPRVSPELTREQILAIREHVRARITLDLHSYRLTARLFRKVGNLPMAKVDDAKARECAAMLRSLEQEDEPADLPGVRMDD